MQPVPTIAVGHGPGVQVRVVVAGLLLLHLGAGRLQRTGTAVYQVPVCGAEVRVGRVAALVLRGARCKRRRSQSGDAEA